MTYVFGEFTLDLERFELRRGTAVVPVEPQVFDVLRYLVEHRDRVVAKEELLDAVWRTRAVTESTLTSRIKVARRALGDDGTSQAYIRTVRGRGFRFLAEVLAPESAEVPGTGPATEEPPRPPPSLPQPVARVVGREAAIEAALDAVRQGRLVTLLGPGGVGKTTIAQCVAAAGARDFPGGVFWCDWSSAAAGASAVEALADAVGSLRQPGATTEGSIVETVGARRIMIVADNCEHLVDTVGPLLERLVARCGGLTVLATSRSPLSVPGERLHPVHPLALVQPAPEGTEAADPPARAPSPAAQLFVDRALAADPDADVGPGQWPLVETICRRLDGLPLALELAAARLRAATLTEVAAELADHVGPRIAVARGRVVRHQTLRNTVDWSFRLLPQAEQRLFTRLWVFPGGFDAGDARALLRLLGEPDADLASGLSVLVDQSMVIADRTGNRTRYRLLETLRAFAREQLTPADVQRVTTANVEWACRLVAKLASAVRGRDEAAAVQVFVQEFPNLRAAVHQAVRAGDVDAAMRLGAGLHLFAIHRLRDEVFAWLEAACAIPGADTHPLFPVALGSLAQGLANRGELSRASVLATEALDGVTGEDVRALWALRTLSNIAVYEGRLDDAIGQAAREVGLATATGDHVHASYAYLTYVLAETYAGRPDRAAEYAAVQQRMATRSGNPTQLAWAAYGRGEMLTRVRPEQAIECFDQALRHAEPVQSHFVTGVALVGLASAQARLGRTREALSTFSRIVDDWHRRGDWTHQWTTLRNVAVLLHRMGRTEDAARLLGACTALGRGAPPYGDIAAQLTQVQGELAGRLGDDRTAELLAAGAAQAPDDVVQDVQRVIAAART